MIEQMSKSEFIEAIATLRMRKFQFGNDKKSYSITSLEVEHHRAGGKITVLSYNRAGMPQVLVTTIGDWAQFLVDNNGRQHWTVNA